MVNVQLGHPDHTARLSEGEIRGHVADRRARARVSVASRPWFPRSLPGGRMARARTTCPAGAA